MTRGRAAGLATVALAAIALAVPWPAATVERAFSAGVYPPWQRVATTATNALPLAAFDLVLAAGVLALVAGAVRAWRRGSGGRWRRAGGALASMLVVTAAMYLWFLCAWGLNYQRVPIADRVGLDRRQATPERLAAFAEQTVDELNRLHGAVASGPWPDDGALIDALRGAFRSALPRVGVGDGVVPGRPKWSLLQPYLRWSGVDGVTNPFTPEIVVNHDLLPMERPFTVAHEWGHLAGLAHEAEASYAAWLTCEAATDQARYSARLWVFAHVFASTPRERRTALLDRLGDGPRDDLRAISRRTAHSVRIVRTLSWATYDRYLKTNRVTEGLASYDAALVLILAGEPPDRTDSR
jgi:hypothetical protein